MNDGTPFDEMRLNKKPLKDCEMVLECSPFGHYRLYFDKFEYGFCAMAVEFNCCMPCGPDTSVWDGEGLCVDQLFQVTAYFDGVRHLEFNRSSDMPGYIYYPSMQGLVELFQKIRELELEYCRECDK